jgi:hypothetical protein
MCLPAIASATAAVHLWLKSSSQNPESQCKRLQRKACGNRFSVHGIPPNYPAKIVRFPNKISLSASRHRSATAFVATLHTLHMNFLQRNGIPGQIAKGKWLPKTVL